MWQKCLPVIVAVALFAVLSCVYCLPVLQGKVIYTADDVQGRAAVQESVKYHEDTGNYTWWTGSMFAGMPNYQIGGGKYLSSRLMQPIIKLCHPSSKKMPLVFIMFFCSFYIMFRAFRVDKWLSIVAALATGFSSYFFIIEAAGHNGKAWSIAMMSVVLGGFYLIFRKRYGWGVVLTMIFTAMGFSPHPQMAYYMFMLIGLLFIVEIWQHIREKRYKDLVLATVLFAGSVLVGMGTGSANIFANKEYAAETMRGGHSELTTQADANKTRGLNLDYATLWSYGIGESLTFLIPGYMGTASGTDVGTESVFYRELVGKGVSKSNAADICSQAPTYWGEQPFTVGSVYAGAAVCFLFLLGLLIVKGPYKWGLLIATFLSFALSWGKNWMGLTSFFFDWFPMYDKFRSVSSILIVAEITMPLLGFLAVKQIMDGKVEKKEINRNIYIAAGITGGICLFLGLFGGSLFSFTSSYDAELGFPDWAYQALISQRASMLRSDSFRSLLFVLLSAGTVWLFANGKLKEKWMVIAMGVIVIADMWPVDRRFLNDSNYVTPKQSQNVYAMQPYEKAILSDPDPHFRVFNLAAKTFNDARTSYYLKSLGGYSAAKLRRYQDIIDRYLSNVDIDVISMLNAKYIITKGDDGSIAPMLNPDALGNAWFVDTLLVAENPIEECDALGRINLRTQAVLDREFQENVRDFQYGSGAGSTISLNTYAPDALTYSADAKRDGVAVFSEIYYPYGWKAYVDGKETDIFRVNYLLRAINVPAGSHDIRFEFRPDSVRKGDMLSVFCVVLMYAVVIALTAGTLIRARRQRKSA